MPIEPVNIHIYYNPLMPKDDRNRVQPFSDEEYSRRYDEPFDEIVQELIDLSITLIKLLPDPSLSPDERLERLARIVPSSQMVTANRRTARSKLNGLRRRLDELVPNEELDYRQKLEWLINHLNELVPGDMRAIAKLERIGDYRSTDVGVSPRMWQ